MSDDEYIAGQEIAELLELTPARVSYMTREGIIEQDGKGRYPMRSTLHRLFRWYRTRIGEGRTKAAQLKQEAQALQTEILKETLRRTKGETITIHAAEKVHADIILRARDKLLRVANKIGPQIPFMKDQPAIEKLIQDVIEEALTELSRPVEYREDNTPEDEP